MANLDTRQKRESGFGVNLPFSRALPTPDGSDADTVRQRAALVMNYLLELLADLSTRQLRECGFGICLPFTRPGFTPDGSDADTEAQRTFIAMNYCGIATVAAVGAVMNQLQFSNVGADLYNGTLQ